MEYDSKTILIRNLERRIEYLKEKGWSVRALASEAGFTPRWLHDTVRNLPNKTPTLDKLDAIAKVIACHPWALIMKEFDPASWSSPEKKDS